MSTDATLTPAGLYELLATEIAGAVAALAGDSTSIAGVESPGETAWRARIAATGAAAGEIHVGLADEDGRRVSALVMGFDPADVTDDAVLDTLREVCGQAIGALSQAPATSAITLKLVEVTRSPFGDAPGVGFKFVLPGDVSLMVVAGGDIALRSGRASPSKSWRPRRSEARRRRRARRETSTCCSTSSCRWLSASDRPN
jgi:hypothetical protein